MEMTKLMELSIKTMSVPEMQRMLGLGKTEAYWLIKHRDIEVVTLNGKLRIVKDSFERWYAGQVKYRKINGDLPGRKLTQMSYSVQELAEMLNVTDDTIYTRIHNGEFETFEADYRTRIMKDSFDRWYASQNRLRLPADREHDDELRSVSYSMPEIGRMLGIHRNTVYAILNSRNYIQQFVFVNVSGQRRVMKDSFEKWYESQTRYLKITVEPEEISAQESEPEREITEKKYYRIDEVMALTGLGKKRIYTLIRNMEIDTVTIGRSFMIAAVDVNRLTVEGGKDHGGNQAEK